MTWGGERARVSFNHIKKTCKQGYLCNMFNVMCFPNIVPVHTPGYNRVVQQGTEMTILLIRAGKLSPSLTNTYPFTNINRMD